ncbi:unnamed protein product [Amoebophrya sp. A120]|nr:unnamed protein product [Amoebophrya sp. A120]|eukprot:GSA120T00004673001.1
MPGLDDDDGPSPAARPTRGGGGGIIQKSKTFALKLGKSRTFALGGADGEVDPYDKKLQQLQSEYRGPSRAARLATRFKREREKAEAAFQARRIRALRILDHPLFEGVVFLAIIVNAVWMGFDTARLEETEGDEEASRPFYFMIIDTLFILVFGAELVIRIQTYKKMFRDFWDCPVMKWWNRLESILLLLYMVDSFAPAGSLDGVKGLSVLRLGRVTRLGKLLRVIPGFDIILGTFMEGLSHMIAALMILILFIYAGAMLLTIWYYQVMSSNLRDDFEPICGALSTSMFTTFKMLTLNDEGITALQRILTHREVSSLESTVMLLILGSYMATGGLTILNILVGIYVDVVDQVRQREYDLDTMEKLIDIFHLIDVKGTGTITREGFRELKRYVDKGMQVDLDLELLELGFDLLELEREEFLKHRNRLGNVDAEHRAAERAEHGGQPSSPGGSQGNKNGSSSNDIHKEYYQTSTSLHEMNLPQFLKIGFKLLHPIESQEVLSIHKNVCSLLKLLDALHYDMLNKTPMLNYAAGESLKKYKMDIMKGKVKENPSWTEKEKEMNFRKLAQYPILYPAGSIQHAVQHPLNECARYKENIQLRRHKQEMMQASEKRDAELLFMDCLESRDPDLFVKSREDYNPDDVINNPFTSPVATSRCEPLADQLVAAKEGRVVDFKKTGKASISSAKGAPLGLRVVGSVAALATGMKSAKMNKKKKEEDQEDDEADVPDIFKTKKSSDGADGGKKGSPLGGGKKKKTGLENLAMLKKQEEEANAITGVVTFEGLDAVRKNIGGGGADDPATTGQENNTQPDQITTENLFGSPNKPEFVIPDRDSRGAEALPAQLTSASLKQIPLKKSSLEASLPAAIKLPAQEQEGPIEHIPFAGLTGGDAAPLSPTAAPSMSTSKPLQGMSKEADNAQAKKPVFGNKKVPPVPLSVQTNGEQANSSASPEEINLSYNSPDVNGANAAARSPGTSASSPEERGASPFGRLGKQNPLERLGK